MRKTLTDFRNMVRNGKRIVGFTCSDVAMASCMEAAGADLILVDDSINLTHLGNQSMTFGLYMEEMLALARAVRRGCRNTFVIGDMPFPTYQSSNEDAIRNASRIIQECANESVMIEGSTETICDRIHAVSDAGIAVMGHIGITPQQMVVSGGLHRRSKEDRDKILADAKRVEDAGAWAIMIEGVDQDTTKLVWENSDIPIFSMGSGTFSDGSINEYADILGFPQQYHKDFIPTPYMEYKELLISAFKSYVGDVNQRKI